MMHFLSTTYKAICVHMYIYIYSLVYNYIAIHIYIYIYIHRYDVCASSNSLSQSALRGPPLAIPAPGVLHGVVRGRLYVCVCMYFLFASEGDGMSNSPPAARFAKTQTNQTT